MASNVAPLWLHLVLLEASQLTCAVSNCRASFCVLVANALGGLVYRRDHGPHSLEDVMTL